MHKVATCRHLVATFSVEVATAQTQYRCGFAPIVATVATYPLLRKVVNTILVLWRYIYKTGSDGSDGSDRGEIAEFCKFVFYGRKV